MLNPFIFGPKSVKASRAANDDQLAPDGIRLSRQKFPWRPFTLRLGHLLIRMGNKLAREDQLQYKSGHLVS
jgi:hypothetical protein